MGEPEGWEGRAVISIPSYLGPLRGIDLLFPGRNAHYSFFNRLSCSGRQLW